MSFNKEHYNLFQVKSQYPKSGYDIIFLRIVLFLGGGAMYPRIRDLRQDRDLNQTQVAKMLGMSQTGYSKYETGENDIPTEVLIKLARFYNTSVDYLLGETNDQARYTQK